MSPRDQRGRIARGPVWRLKGSIGFCLGLITVKSGKVSRKRFIEDLKRYLEVWVRNPAFEELRKSAIDLAIVVKMDEYRFKHQDVDNVVKIVLDALKKGGESDPIYLFEDDSQVARLLVWKMKREEDYCYDTDQLAISFRKHNPAEQMEMVKEG
jgi:Holliday junction resolvase RusA-like endonuclease